jgi:hypothetical protein
MSPALNLNQCQANFEVEAHYEHPDVLTNITVTVTQPLKRRRINKELASLTAIRVKLYAAWGRFLAIMDEHSDELHQFSMTLFDKNGRIQPGLVDGSKGSGCWGPELNNRDIIYVMDVFVHPDVSVSFFLKKICRAKALIVDTH